MKIISIFLILLLIFVLVFYPDVFVTGLIIYALIYLIPFLWKKLIG